MLPIELVDGFSVANAQACVEASAAAYSEPPTVQSPLAHVLIQDSGNAILIAFRGTQNAVDWLTDLEAWHSKISALRWTSGPTRGGVHHGFASAIESVSMQLSHVLAEQFPGRPVVLTGHSLGGALAQLYAPYITNRLHSVYTFGGPRAGDRAWAEYYDLRPLSQAPSSQAPSSNSGSDKGGETKIVTLADRTFRIVNQVDIVARAPGLLAGYRHTGIEVLLTPSGSLWLSPPWWLKAWADLWAVWSDVHTRRLGVLLDHRIGPYAQRISAQSCHQSTNPLIHQST